MLVKLNSWWVRGGRGTGVEKKEEVRGRKEQHTLQEKYKNSPLAVDSFSFLTTRKRRRKTRPFFKTARPFSKKKNTDQISNQSTIQNHTTQSRFEGEALLRRRGIHRNYSRIQFKTTTATNRLTGCSTLGLVGLLKR